MKHELSYEIPDPDVTRLLPWFGSISLACALATYGLVALLYTGFNFRDRYFVLLIAMPLIGFASGIIRRCRGEKSGTPMAGLILNALSLLVLGCGAAMFGLMFWDFKVAG